LTNSGPKKVNNHYGQATAALVAEVFAEGAARAVLLMRHSAREFNRDIHDLLNPLTDHGRDLCTNLGQALPKDLYVKGYASPAERCVETAQIVIDAHVRAGGEGGRTRPVEGLGVFYCVDQMKMWKVMSEADGLADYVGRWIGGEVPRDAMIPAEIAARTVLDVMYGKLIAAGSQRQLDLCVSHDMTLYTVRHQLGLEPVTGPDVEFLDGLILYSKGDDLLLASHHGGLVKIAIESA
jgi:hypothetical protein